MNKYFITTLLGVFLTLCAIAQKLPDIQKVNISVPNNLRIDGKNLEWNNFAAYNKRTNLFYTLTNDSKNIYLALKVSDNQSITKLLIGGLTFSVNTNGKKKEESSFQLTYPLIKRATNMGGQRQGRAGLGQNRQELSKEQQDSAQFVQRVTQLATVKEIGVKGFAVIADSLISIYNEYGIKAIGKMEADKSYFCEIAIPISMLNIGAKTNIELAYQIKLNGRSTMNFRGGGGNFSRGRGGFGAANMSQADLWTATDFWGKYLIQNTQ